MLAPETSKLTLNVSWFNFHLLKKDEGWDEEKDAEGFQVEVVEVETVGVHGVLGVGSGQTAEQKMHGFLKTLK